MNAKFIILFALIFTFPKLSLSEKRGFNKYDTFKLENGKLRFVVPEKLFKHSKQHRIEIEPAWFETTRSGRVTAIKAKPGKPLALNFEDKEHDSVVFSIETKNLMGIKKEYDVIVDYSNFIRVFYPETQANVAPLKPLVVPYSKVNTEYRHKTEELYKIATFSPYNASGKKESQGYSFKEVLELRTGQAYLANYTDQTRLVYDFVLKGVFKDQNQTDKVEIVEYISKSQTKITTFDPKSILKLQTPPFFISEFLGWYYINNQGQIVEVAAGQEIDVPALRGSEFRLIARYKHSIDNDKLGNQLNKQGLVGISYFDGAESVLFYTVKKGEPLLDYRRPKSGYRLVGWFKDPALTDKVDFNTERADKNITLYAKYERDNSQPLPGPNPATKYTVKFVTRPDAQQISDIYVLKNGKIDKNYLNPNLVSYIDKNGDFYRLAGWKVIDPITGELSADLFDFDTPITKDITLQAVFKKSTGPNPFPNNLVSVNFYDKNGNIVDTLTYNIGEKITQTFSNSVLGLGEKDEFLGWANLPNGEVITDLKANLANRSLYPVYRLKSPQTKYEIKRHLEKVDGNGFDVSSEIVQGVEPNKEVQLSADKLVAPRGFELDSNSITKKTILANGTTVFNLYFKRKTYKSTFDYNGGTQDGKTKKEVDYKFGQTIKDIDKPVKSDPQGLKTYTFTGWLNQETNELMDFSKENIVEKNLNLVAKWEETANTKKVYLNLVYEGLASSTDSENEVELPTQKKIGTTVSANDQDIKDIITAFLSSHPHPHYETEFDVVKSISSLIVENNTNKQTLKLYFKAKRYTVNFNLTESGLNQNTIAPILKQTITLKYTNKLSQEIYDKLLAVKKLSTANNDFEFEKLIVEETGVQFNQNHDYNTNITIKPVFKAKDVFASVTPRVQSTDFDKTDTPAWPVQNAKVGEIFNFTPTTNIKYGYKLLGWTDVEGGSVKDIFVTRQTKEVFAVLDVERADYQIVHYLEIKGGNESLNNKFDEIIENKTNQLVKDKAIYTPYEGPDKDLYYIDFSKPSKLVADLVPGSNTNKVFRYYRLRLARVDFEGDAGIERITPSFHQRLTRKVSLPEYKVKDGYKFLGWSLERFGGEIQTEFNFVVKELLNVIYAKTELLKSEITYTIRKERTDGTFEETTVKKTGQVGSTHNVEYTNFDSSIYDIQKDPTSLLVSPDVRQNKVTITLKRKIFKIAFRMFGSTANYPERNLKHGEKIGEISETQFHGTDKGIVKTKLDSVEKSKNEIENHLVTKEHVVDIHIGTTKRIFKYPQTKVDNLKDPEFIEKQEDIIPFISEGTVIVLKSHVNTTAITKAINTKNTTEIIICLKKLSL